MQDCLSSVSTRSYLDRVLVRRAETDFVTCLTFHYVAWTDNSLVRINLKLANKPSLAGYWKFKTFLQEIWDFRDRLESLVQRASVGAITRNKCCGSLKHRIRDFAIKYSHQLKIVWTKVTKSLEDNLARVLEGAISEP